MFLMPFAVVLLVAQALVPTSGQTANHSRQQNKQQRGKTDTSQRPSQPNTLSSDGFDGSKTKAEDEDRPGYGNNQVSVNIGESATVPVPWRWYEKVAWVFNILLTCVGGFGLYYAWGTVQAARKSAEAALSSVKAVILSERPFVFIETRGEQGFEFWAVNYGKSPAQIIFSNTSPFVTTPLLEELPTVLNYGYGFDNPDLRQINVQWIAPGKSHYLGAFDPKIMEQMSEGVTRELIESNRVMLVYSAFKYRGIQSRDVYVSTYCYRKYPSGLHMWGGNGWNEYT